MSHTVESCDPLAGNTTNCENANAERVNAGESVDVESPDVECADVEFADASDADAGANDPACTAPNSRPDGCADNIVNGDSYVFEEKFEGKSS